LGDPGIFWFFRSGGELGLSPLGGEVFVGDYSGFSVRDRAIFPIFLFKLPR